MKHKMTPAEYRKIVEQDLELTQASAAGLFGFTDRTARRHVNGENGISGPLVILLRLLAAGKITIYDVVNASRMGGKHDRHADD
jgi:hypothetical protein